MWETQKRTNKMFWIKSTRTPHSDKFLRLVHLHDKNNSQCLTNYWVALTLWYSCFSIIFLHQLTAAVRKVAFSLQIRRCVSPSVTVCEQELASASAVRLFPMFCDLFNFCTPPLLLLLRKCFPSNLDWNDQWRVQCCSPQHNWSFPYRSAVSPMLAVYIPKFILRAGRRWHTKISRWWWPVLLYMPYECSSS